MQDEIVINQHEGDQILIKIAKTLFYINLLPAILGIVMIVVMLIFISTGHFTYMNLFRNLLLIAGVFCEWIYLKKFRFPENSINKAGWIYSIILNVIFILYYIVCFMLNDPLAWPLLMAGYPLLFLVASCYALQRSWNVVVIGKDS
jgi:hypothetical protein